MVSDYTAEHEENQKKKIKNELEATHSIQVGTLLA